MEILKQKSFGRGQGILLPIFSLPGEFGIGTLGFEAKKTVDFISLSGGSYWQVLPLGPTGFGDSPYQCFSAFAGNPYLIDPEWLYKKGWLKAEELSLFVTKNSGRVDYGYLYKTRKSALENAYIGFLKNATNRDKTDFLAFKAMASFWLNDYAYFSALKKTEKNPGREGIKTKAKVSLADKSLRDEMDFIRFLEYVFYTQWQELKSYANSKGIEIIGDIPLYVADDSADVWANPGLFMLDKDYKPALVAGVPPDSFSASGQLWGNPLYNWEAHKTENFAWWKSRIAWQAKLFNIIRLDHFVGIVRYFSIPAASTTAVSGEWLSGPGKLLTDVFFKAAPNTKFIAEDLGELTPNAARLLRDIGYPGMKLMQFGFEGDSSVFPWNIEKNTVIYPGTHDNKTLAEFFNTTDKATKKFALDYLGVDLKKLTEATITDMFKSPANTLIVPLQDYLGLGAEARINTPATKDKNWQWRLKKLPSLELAEKIKNYSKLYKRENKNERGI